MQTETTGELADLELQEEDLLLLLVLQLLDVDAGGQLTTHGKLAHVAPSIPPVRCNVSASVLHCTEPFRLLIYANTHLDFRFLCLWPISSSKAEVGINPLSSFASFAFLLSLPSMANLFLSGDRNDLEDMLASEALQIRFMLCSRLGQRRKPSDVWIPLTRVLSHRHLCIGI